MHGRRLVQEIQKNGTCCVIYRIKKEQLFNNNTITHKNLPGVNGYYYVSERTINDTSSFCALCKCGCVVQVQVLRKKSSCYVQFVVASCDRTKRLRFS
jgi:hypothetical protein